MAAEQVVPFQTIPTRTFCSHVHVEHKTSKDQCQPKVGEQDVALVEIVQTPRWRGLPKEGGQGGDHEGGPT